VLWQGQTGLVVTAALIGGWYFAYRNQWILGGILIAIASIKPHLSILVILWLLLDRQWRLLAVAAVTVLVFSLVPMVVSGPIDVFLDWYATVKRYQITTSGLAAQLSTIQHILEISGIKGMPTLVPLGMIITGILWWYRSKFFLNDIFGMWIGAGQRTCKKGFPAFFALCPPHQDVMLWPPCVRCPCPQGARPSYLNGSTPSGIF
jgi:hypothetical protein